MKPNLLDEEDNRNALLERHRRMRRSKAAFVLVRPRVLSSPLLPHPAFLSRTQKNNMSSEHLQAENLELLHQSQSVYTVAQVESL